MLPPKHRNSRQQLHTSSSTLSLTPNRLFTLISDYFKSLSEVDANDLAEQSELNWVDEQKEFVDLLRKKLEKFRGDPEYKKYVELLGKTQVLLDRVQKKKGTQPRGLMEQEQRDHSGVSEISAIQFTERHQHAVAHSIDRLKETISAKENLLHRNYQTEKSKNQELLSQIRQQKCLIETQEKEIKELKRQLQMATKARPTSREKVSNKETIALIKDNEAKDKQIEQLKKQIAKLKDGMNTTNNEQSVDYQRAELNNLLTTNLELKTSNHLLQLKLQKLTKTIYDQQQRLKQNTVDPTALQTLTNENISLTQSNRELQQRIEEIIQELEEIRISDKNANEIRAENQELRKHMVYKSKNQQLLQGKIKTLEEELEALEQTTQQATKNLRECRVQLRQTQQKCDLFKQKYFRLRQNLPDVEDTSQILKPPASTSEQTSRSRVDPLSQQKKLRVLTDLKQLVRNHRSQLQTLR